MHHLHQRASDFPHGSQIMLLLEQLAHTPHLLGLHHAHFQFLEHYGTGLRPAPHLCIAVFAFRFHRTMTLRTDCDLFSPFCSSLNPIK